LSAAPQWMQEEVFATQGLAYVIADEYRSC
jgi:hypothetical protein